MSALVAILFEGNKHGAADALNKLHKLEKEYLIDLEDAVIVQRREDGKIKLKQMVNLTGSGAWEGAFWGSLIGLIFTGPLGMLIVGGMGAGFGALAGSVSDYGIDDEFIKGLSDGVKPCCSGLFLLIRNMTEDKVFEELKGLGGIVLKTSLSKEAEKRLTESLQRSHL
ncbi:MAG: DUF1269 domain-containing protein [Candidatus Omnitrophica bacterium]|nr:DUF1269 domain-containing protein [Candidatus Omnitrophota bacterium]